MNEVESLRSSLATRSVSPRSSAGEKKSNNGTNAGAARRWKPKSIGTLARDSLHKVDIAHAIAATGRYLLIRIAEVLCVSRSNLYEQLLKKRQQQPARYSKDDDARLLPLIRQICRRAGDKRLHVA